MAKLKADTKLDASDEFAQTSVEVIVPVFDKVSIALVKREGRNFDIIKVPFNSTTLESGTAEVVEKAEGLEEAQYLFKMNTMKLGIFNG